MFKRISNCIFLPDSHPFPSKTSLDPRLYRFLDHRSMDWDWFHASVHAFLFAVLNPIHLQYCFNEETLFLLQTVPGFLSVDSLSFADCPSGEPVDPYQGFTSGFLSGAGAMLFLYISVCGTVCLTRSPLYCLFVLFVFCLFVYLFVLFDCFVSLFCLLFGCFVYVFVFCLFSSYMFCFVCLFLLVVQNFTRIIPS